MSLSKKLPANKVVLRTKTKTDTIYCLLDANLNRAREGIRIVEDTARFVLNKPDYFYQLRSLRHRLDKITRKIYPLLVSARDTQVDPGRSIIEKGKRRNIKELIVANFRRSEEAVRVLEEYSKMISASAGRQFKDIRYRLYTLEKKMGVRSPTGTCQHSTKFNNENIRPDKSGRYKR